MYLLGVLSEDKTQEITGIMNLNTQYQSLPSSLPSQITSKITKTALEHHQRRFFNPTYAGLITSLTAETTTNTSSEPKTTTVENKSGKKEENELNTIRSQYSRFLPPPPSSPPTRNAFISTVLEVVGKHYHVRSGRMEEEGDDGDEEDWVYLITPFICCLSRPGAICHGFEKLMNRLGEFPPRSIEERKM